MPLCPILDQNPTLWDKSRFAPPHADMRVVKGAGHSEKGGSKDVSKEHDVCI